jgi:RES domain-containing protein
MVYCTGSLALAALEAFVHFDPPLLPDDYVSIEVEIPDGVKIEEVDISVLPPDWRDTPGPDDLRTIGSDWVASGASAVLSVPSAIIPQERNFVLNPEHPDFSKLVAHPPEPFGFDSRMIKPLAAAPKPAKKAAAPKPAKKAAAPKPAKKAAAPKPAKKAAAPKPAKKAAAPKPGRRRKSP